MTAARRASWVAVAVLVAACGSSAPTPTPRPVPTEAASPEPSDEAGTSCPGLQFDASASLDPMFDGEDFPGDQSKQIGSAFVAALDALYAGDTDADPCAVFTGPGLESAVALDPRLGPALGGTRRLDAGLVFRHASEGTYDLRQRPPRVPIDVIFDIPAGATTTDAGSGATDTTEAPQRVQLRVTFAYDGSAWLADRVERVPPEDAAAWALPTPIAALRPCKGFHDDPDLLRFDDGAGSGPTRDRQRAWCADGGRGDALPSALVALWTRYPCEAGRIALLQVGWPLGTPDDNLDHHQYLRDPDGDALQRGWLHEPWKRGVKLPDGAENTGWTNGNMDLWIDPSEVESAVYVRTAGRFERWPRADNPSVIDCN